MFGRKPEQVKVQVDGLQEKVTQIVQEIVSRAIADSESLLAKVRSSFDLAKHIHDLREQIETLKIEKARKEEDFARQQREVEHKVGLERKRQEFEIAQAKREVTVSVREENLKADRTRFEEQLKFHEDRFSKEVGYLKEMLTEMLKRLPSAEITIEEKRRTGTR